MSMELESYLEKVVDEESFLEFAKALKADQEAEDLKEKVKPSAPYSSGQNGWGNSTVSGFLESAIAWAEDGEFGNTIEPDANPWKKFALFLYGGKIYE